MTLRSTAIKTLSKLAANPPAQRLLDLNVAVCHALMGVGSTAGLESSAEKRLLKRSIDASPGPKCIFDVGANYGQYLGLILECAADRDVTVHCFEPSSAAYAHLQEARGDRSHVTLNHFGLGREQGTLTLFSDAPGSGMASLTKRDLGQRVFDHAETIEVKTLDGYCKEAGIEHIDFLKIDVEGHELGVLEGGTQMFESRRIDKVMFEFGGPAIDSRTFFRDYFRFFESVGMELSRLTPAGWCVPLPRYKGSLEQFRGCSLMVATRC